MDFTVQVSVAVRVTDMFGVYMKSVENNKLENQMLAGTSLEMVTAHFVNKCNKIGNVCDQTVCRIFVTISMS